MKLTMKSTIVLVLAAGLNVGPVPAIYAADLSLSGQEGQMVSELGVPEPGSVSDQEREKQGATAPPDLRPDETRQEPASASKDSRATKDVKGEVVRGKIVKIEKEVYTVKDRSGKEVSLHVDRNTQMGNVNLKDEFFKEGDRIEAFVTPTGHAHSISVLRSQPNSPNDPEGGG